MQPPVGGRIAVAILLIRELGRRSHIGSFSDRRPLLCALFA